MGVSVPVLMYHHVLPQEGFIASSITQFEAQMRYLAETGWSTLDSDTFARYKQGELDIPKKSVMITFDDGWRDNFVYAYPILKRYDLKATIFVVTEWIEKASQKREIFEPLHHKACKQIISEHPASVILSWNDLEAMRDVFEVHSHTHSHRDSYFEGSFRWEEEFELSKELLETRLGIKTRHLCWPRGQYDDSLVNKACKSGLDILYTTKRGVNPPDCDTYAIKRIGAKKGARWLAKNLALFSHTLSGSLYAKLKPE